jgi:hypothetical protein
MAPGSLQRNDLQLLQRGVSTVVLSFIGPRTTFQNLEKLEIPNINYEESARLVVDKP